MKKEELTALGISEDVAAKVLEINGKDIEHAKAVKDKDIKTLQDERDGYKTRAETAEATLQNFDGIDPQKIQSELQTWKDKAAAAEKDFNAKITQRDQRDWIKGQLDTYGVTSPYARSAIQAECMDEKSGLKWKDGAFFGFDEYMKKAKEKDPGLYQTDEEKAEAEKQKQQQEKAPAFTGPAGDGKTGGDGKKPFTVPTVF